MNTRERITHDPVEVRACTGALIWTVHQLSIEQRNGTRLNTPVGYDWHYGWVRKSDGKRFDFYTLREFPALEGAR